MVVVISLCVVDSRRNEEKAEGETNYHHPQAGTTPNRTSRQARSHISSIGGRSSFLPVFALCCVVALMYLGTRITIRTIMNRLSTTPPSTAINKPCSQKLAMITSRNIFCNWYAEIFPGDSAVCSAGDSAMYLALRSSCVLILSRRKV